MKRKQQQNTKKKIKTNKNQPKYFFRDDEPSNDHVSKERFQILLEKKSSLKFEQNKHFFFVKKSFHLLFDNVYNQFAKKTRKKVQKIC